MWGCDVELRERGSHLRVNARSRLLEEGGRKPATKWLGFQGCSRDDMNRPDTAS
jgi:hypothetical protein